MAMVHLVECRAVFTASCFGFSLRCIHASLPHSELSVPVLELLVFTTVPRRPIAQVLFKVDIVLMTSASLC